ncbi:rhodanese-like domain-containing protein [Promineifilum sp.]|uniref:rhodanese-like domain-containing protein n=1 Tax=Promineifilum sp. TaxID=2664178 RepID=UPI0035B2254C
MKKMMLLSVLTLTLLLLAACGGETASPMVEEPSAASLPDTVDVATVYSLQDSPDIFLLDVREPDEYAAGHIPGVTLIPMGEVASRMSELPTDTEIIVTCRTGNRSSQVADFLREQGFTNVHNMEGGLVAWQEAGYTVEQ